MELNQVDIHYLIAAICVISSALIFYTIGVWGGTYSKEIEVLAYHFLPSRFACRYGWHKSDGAHRRTDSST